MLFIPLIAPPPGSSAETMANYERLLIKHQRETDILFCISMAPLAVMALSLIGAAIWFSLFG